MTPLLALSCCWMLAAPAVADDPPRPAAAASDPVSALEDAVAAAIARAEPSVVAIHRDKAERPEEVVIRGRPRLPYERPGGVRFAMDPIQGDVISFDFGSGVVVGGAGQILTAYHVVKGAGRLVVRAAMRQQFEAEILAADPRSDLAVIAPIAIAGVPSPKLRPIPMGDASKLRKGSFLVALGNSFNAARKDGKPSASFGILSNVARRIDEEEDLSGVSARRSSFLNFPTLLQLDSKLNQGMSGGAVVNLKGELVGLTTMAASPAGFDNMAGYAMPMDRMGRRAVEILKQGKEIEYGLLGVRPPRDRSNRVDSVSPNSPAGQGDLQANDEILAVDDEPILDFDDLILSINARSPGDRVRLRIRRGNEELARSLVLAKFPVDPEAIATVRPAAWRGLRVDYQSTALVTTRLPFAEPSGPGVLVSEVEDGSPADKAGLKKLQVIRQVDGNPVTNPAEFAAAVAGTKGEVSLTTDSGPVTVPE
ncbi:Periplasmic pH-dependent serine endoprotease DegQ precursor [Aquisphaera giovannonii]|uniref:Periplasmic pH-dependent serine endoprotease DegQ n=1 Tax=Aquisphaera giovannonii TaxID=406548 RepID=A0A5B9WC31_9BACT|nr:trypsin-like peptidase domain-containing protein [Aquisphaera giovannonii]QEH37440.1 Periplasmic pH-dependent serine endoprotease DegQ precursor [Aquisphaera giovannonii]